MRRVVFDTNTALSALVYLNGRLAWLRHHWTSDLCTPLLSRDTAAELSRILAYPKFRIAPDSRLELLGDYFPYCKTIDTLEPYSILCRDPKDQMFLDLAYSGNAEILVSGDRDILALAGQTKFLIESPENYRLRIQCPERVS